MGAFAMILWCAALTYPYFALLMRAKRLRVSPLYEIIGLDILMHEEREKLPYICQKTHQILRENKSRKLAEDLEKEY